MGLLGLAFSAATVAADLTDKELETRTFALRDEWENIFYGLPQEQQADRFKAMLDQLEVLTSQHPRAASPRALMAMVLCTYAGAHQGLDSLTLIEKARDLSHEAIQLDPRALEGSAWITLGNLYQRLPGWPISFGDNAKAREYLSQVLKLFPAAMDTNYFYGNFLLEQGEYDEALKYLEKARAVVLTDDAGIGDQQMKQQIENALIAAREHHASHDDFFSRILPDWLIPATQTLVK